VELWLNLPPASASGKTRFYVTGAPRPHAAPAVGRANSRKFSLGYSKFQSQSQRNQEFDTATPKVKRHVEFMCLNIVFRGATLDAGVSKRNRRTSDHSALSSQGYWQTVKANVQEAPSFIGPMKALAVQKLPEGDWLYEIKRDGYRALAFEDGKNVRLASRNKKEFDDPQFLNYSMP
jgi:ATP-dependent DNA ligase